MWRGLTPGQEPARVAQLDLVDCIFIHSIAGCWATESLFFKIQRRQILGMPLPAYFPARAVDSTLCRYLDSQWDTTAPTVGCNRSSLTTISLMIRLGVERLFMRRHGRDAYFSIFECPCQIPSIVSSFADKCLDGRSLHAVFSFPASTCVLTVLQQREMRGS